MLYTRSDREDRQHLKGYFGFHLHHSYYNIEYLGTNLKVRMLLDRLEAQFYRDPKTGEQGVVYASSGSLYVASGDLSNLP